jgi:uncharacterized membrane protein
MLLAMNLTINESVVGLVLTAISLIGAAAGFITWKAVTTYRAFVARDTEREKKTQEEDRALRDSLRDSYKEMYEVEKTRSTREIEDLKTQLTHLRSEVDYMTSRQKELRDESDRLRDLNLKYQEDKRKDAHKIADLEQTIHGFEKEIGVLKQKVDSPAR